MNIPCLMQSLISRLSVICLILLSACSSRPLLSVSAIAPDSLSEATKREIVAASLQSAKGEYHEAVSRYRKLLAAQPSNAALHYALSQAYIGLGVIDSARLYSEKSVILNPGNKYYLRLLAAISRQMRDYSQTADLDRQLVALEPGRTEPLFALAFDYLAADQFEKVRKGMWRVVNDADGTARKARVKGFEVAGKTGTAQFWRNGIKDYHTWFVCFAPYDKPRYVVCVFVQGGHSGGSVPAPIAAKILEQIFAMEKGQEVKLEVISPAVGNFQPIAGIDFSKDLPAQYGGDAPPAPEATGEETPETDNSSNGGTPTAKPDIKEDADSHANNKKPQAQGGLQKFFNFLGGGRSAVPKQSN